jgi:hypothetical protein
MPQFYDIFSSVSNKIFLVLKRIVSFVLVNYVTHYTMLHQLVSKTRFLSCQGEEHVEEEINMKLLVMCMKAKRQHMMIN